MGGIGGSAAGGQAPFVPRGLRQAAVRDRLLSGDSTARLLDRPAGSSVKLLQRLLGALLVAGVLALLLAALWLGSSRCDTWRVMTPHLLYQMCSSW